MSNILEQEIEELKKKLEATEANLQLQQMRQIILNTDNENLLKRLEIAKTRPLKPSKVYDWAMMHFGSQIIIHERAKRLMKEIKNEEVDLHLLCDAIEFLANEYWDVQSGIIDIDECRRLCSLYYNNPFEIGECDEQNISDYPEDYRVLHNNSSVQLTQYLKAGTDSNRPVWIYFFYDKTDHSIVIGSMPKQLPTVSY